MSLKDLISAAFSKDAVTFESTLHAVMQEKMANAIQSRFSPAVYEEEVDLEEAKASKKDDEEDDDEDEMCEEVEQIDELSKKTLGSYIKKASVVAARKSGDEQHAVDRAQDKIDQERPDHGSAKFWRDRSTKIGHTVKNRIAGISKAADRLTKEEVEQIDEISKTKMGQYIKRAADDKQTQTNRAAVWDQKGSDADKDADMYSAWDKARKARKKADNRSKFIGKAVDRLTKEEVEQIDELSKKTLGSYVKKASQHSAEVAHEMGQKRAVRDDVARFTNRHMADKQKVRDELEKTLGADNDTERANRKTFNKRSSGIDRAIDKLSK